MAGRLPLLAAALAAAAAFPGCLGGGEGEAAGTCSVAVSGLPAHVVAAEAFTFDARPSCDFPWESDHVGAHAGTGRSTAPSTAVYGVACLHHSENSTGDSYATTCTLAEPGTYFLRGHARILVGGVATDFWSPEYVVIAQEADPPAPGSVQLYLMDVPSTVEAGVPFTVGLHVAWAVAPPGVPSDHVGAHWGPTPQDPPTVAGYGNACGHQSGVIPGHFVVSCVLSEGEMRLRGHVRLEESGQLNDSWSDETTLVAA